MGFDVSEASGSYCALAEVVDLVYDGGHVGCIVAGSLSQGTVSSTVLRKSVDVVGIREIKRSAEMLQLRSQHTQHSVNTQEAKLQVHCQVCINSVTLQPKRARLVRGSKLIAKRASPGKSVGEGSWYCRYQRTKRITNCSHRFDPDSTARIGSDHGRSRWGTDD